jgi:hypothetical protein
MIAKGYIMSEAPAKKQDQFIVRLPDGMRNKVKESAELNNRSMNAEIIAGLEDWLSRNDQNELEANNLRKAEDMIKTERIFIHEWMQEIVHRLDQLDRINSAEKK